MKWERHRALKHDARHKRGVGKCRVCGKAIKPERWREHEDCMRTVLNKEDQ